MLFRSGVGLWKAIRKLGCLVTPRFDFVVGDGRKVSFWKDMWCETTPLCESFPSNHLVPKGLSFICKTPTPFAKESPIECRKTLKPQPSFPFI